MGAFGSIDSVGRVCYIKRTMPRQTERKVEIVEWNGKQWRRWPESSRRSDREYFKRYTTWLHRAIWEFHHGPIPKDHHIHHRDHDPSNNDISNLECVPASEHHRDHIANASEETKAKRRASIAIAQLSAPKWHASPEGREWHSQHAKNIAAKRPFLDVQCEVCGI
jgi:hypothetical protein